MLMNAGDLDDDDYEFGPGPKALKGLDNLGLDSDEEGESKAKERASRGRHSSKKASRKMAPPSMAPPDEPPSFARGSPDKCRNRAECTKCAAFCMGRRPLISFRR